MSEQAGGHTVAYEIQSDGWIDPVITCHEPEGAPCRVRCPGECEAWDVYAGRCSECATPVTATACLNVEWWSASGTLVEDYVGDRRPATPGPVEITYDEGPVWRYPGEVAS